MLTTFRGVDDDGEPYEPFDRFTSADADNYGLRFLYIQSCKRVGVNPDATITTQLPPHENDDGEDDDDDDDDDSDSATEFDRVRQFAVGNVDSSSSSTIIGNSQSMVSSSLLQHHKQQQRRNFAILDATRTYLGNGGCSALLPVLACAAHLRHLLLPHVGMRADVGKTLAILLAVHPSIQVVDLSENALGYRVGQLLLTAVLKNRNLTDMGLAGALIVDPLVQRIHKALAHNRRRIRENRIAKDSSEEEDDEDEHENEDEDEVSLDNPEEL